MPGSVSSPPDLMPVLSRGNRHELAVLIPSVIGLKRDDPRMDVRIALRCATTALPVASADALVRRAGINGKGFRRHSAPSTVRLSLRALDEAGISHRDSRLRQLLTDVIDDCEALRLDLSPRSTAPFSRVTAEHAGV